MIVWRITGNGTGPSGNSAHYVTKKTVAVRLLRETIENAGGRENFHGSTKPQRIDITCRAQLAAALNDAMSYSGAATEIRSCPQRSPSTL